MGKDRPEYAINSLLGFLKDTFCFCLSPWNPKVIHPLALSFQYNPENWNKLEAG